MYPRYSASHHDLPRGPAVYLLGATLLLSACGGGPGVDPDAAPDRDASVSDSALSDTGLSDLPADATPDGGGVNACGGATELDGAPGDACGVCGGVLACAGGESLECVSDGEANACGGCELLPGEIGESCGVCGDGIYGCDADALACEGASAANECGGCTALGELPGAPCDAGGEAGTLRCQGSDTLACVADTANACGGTGALSREPGTPCGECDLGVVACDGIDAVICDGDADGLNDCGGCGLLAHELDSACGSCGAGAYACGGVEGVVVCVDPELNSCGGCAPLEGEPGAACDGGAYVCVDGAVTCEPDASNACGGTATLEGAPGDSCGECGDGRLSCVGPDDLRCLADAPLNACDSCGSLAGTPGAPCGPTGFLWTCAADGSLACVVAEPDLVVGLYVDPDTLALVPGSAGPLAAFARLAGGVESDVTTVASWSSDDEAVATVAADGTVSAIASGTATITATHMLQSAAAEITVALVTGLAVTPSSTSLALGRSVSLTATATFEDGSSADVSGSATWTSSSDTTASVAAGAVTTVSEGTVTLTASFGGVDATASVTVTAPEATSVMVTPAASSLALGRGVALSAMASFTDGTSADVTSRCAWASADPSVATVDASGAVTTADVGATNITCTVDGQSASASVAVTAAELESLAVTPDPLVLFVGDAGSLVATGSFSDGTTADVTTLASWLSAAPAIAAVTGPGTVTAGGAGSTTVTASVGAVSGAATVTVTLARLTSITVTPSDPSVAAGVSVAFTAMGSFDDGSSADITGSATWLSTVPGAATVDALGLATGVAVGSTTVRASFDGVSGETTLTVTAAELVGLDVSPAMLTIDAGDTAALAATANFTDGSTVDVTATATWMSSAAGVASVAAGTVTGVAEGMTTVSATYLGAGASSEVTVLPPMLEGLAFEVPGPFTLGVGARLEVRVLGTFSDGSVRDLTAMASWLSSAPTFATVSGVGVTSALAVGASTISATVGGMTATYTVAVRQPQLRSWGWQRAGIVAPTAQVRNWNWERRGIVAPTAQTRNWDWQATSVVQDFP